MNDLTVSVIVPCMNEQDSIEELYKRLTKVLNNIDAEYEILFVDDGSRDATVTQIESLIAKNARCKLIEFSRNFGKEAALSAGLDYCKGDAAVLIDADLQHPPEFIVDLVSTWREGAEIVYGVRGNRDGDGALRRMFTGTFYWILRTMGEVPVPSNAGDFRLLDRKVIDALCSMHERNRFMKGLYAWVGFRTVALPLKVDQRKHGQTSFSLSKLSNFAIDGITAFSTVPLRLAGFTGFSVAALSIIYGLYEFLQALLTGRDTPGFATLIVAILFLGGVQMMFLGVIGEYVGRIYKEVKERPLYISRRKIGL